jgi:hypothetical protein
MGSGYSGMTFQNAQMQNASADWMKAQMQNSPMYVLSTATGTTTVSWSAPGALAPGVFVPSTTAPTPIQMPLPYSTPTIDPATLHALQMARFDWGPEKGLDHRAAVCHVCAAIILFGDGGWEKHRAGCIPPFPKLDNADVE